jgi:CRP-like cAMP-binding protein
MTDLKFAPLQKFYQTQWPDISQHNFKLLAEAHTFEYCKKGQILLEPGQVCDWIGVISQGVMRYYIKADEKENVGQIYLPGQAFTDYSSYFYDAPSRVYIDAIRDAEIFIIKKSSVLKFAKEMPGYLQLLFNYLSRNYIQNLDRTSSLLLDSAEIRYLKLVQNQTEILRQVPLYMIASYLGITPEALSRVRHKIAHSGA